MTYHLIFSGNVKSGVSLFAEQSSRDLIEIRARHLNLRGLLLYKDGNFLFVLEGERDAARIIRQNFKDHNDLSGIITLLEEEVEEAVFKDVSFALCKSDVSTNIENTIYLDDEKIGELLPDNTPHYIRVLIKNFVAGTRMPY